MRDIYLIDFENVASEGLSGITYLSPEDEVIIFYSNNSNRLTMKMHILIEKSVCKFQYFEVTVGGKNALDHQISTWLGYLIGTGAAERNYYIVSRDMGYRFVATFWTDSVMKPSVRCIENVRAAGRLERSRQNREQGKETQSPALNLVQPEPVQQLSPVSATEGTDAQTEELSSEVPVQEVPAEASAQTAAAENTMEESAGAAGPQDVPVPETAEAAAPSAEPAAETRPEEPAEASAPRQDMAEPAEESEASAVAAQPEQTRRNSRNRQWSRRGRSKSGRAGASREPANTSVQQQEAENAPAAAEAQPGTEMKQEAAPQAKPEEKAEPQESRPQAKPEQKAEPKQESHPQAKPEQKAEPKQESRPQAKPEQKTEPKQESRPQGQGEQKEETRPLKYRQKSAGDKAKQPGEPVQIDLSALLAPYPTLHEQELLQIIAANKRQVLCNTLRKQLGQEKGLALYNEIKKSAWR